jgi:hypothetical protein
LETTAAPATPAADWPAADSPVSYQSAPATPAEPVSAADPLAEAPDVVWYVRPPSGGQFGPATGDVMRNWIDEGRVSPEALVWREGWRDWREASEVFPAPGAAKPDLGTGIVTQPAAPASGGHAATHARRSKNMNAAIIAVLVLAVIVLFAVFLYVAFGSKPSDTQSSSHDATRPRRTVRQVADRQSLPITQNHLHRQFA